MASVFCCRAVSQGPNLKRRSFSWRKLISWSMIDFSNSLVLMICNSLYAGYFTAYYFGQAEEKKTRTQSLLTTSNIVNSALMMVLSPILGAMSDIFYIRVPTLAIATLIFGVFTICLYKIPDTHQIAYYIGMHTVINFFFRVNETVVGAFLPSLCNDRDMGFASGMGFCIGFLSGVLVILLFRTLNPTICYYKSTTVLNPEPECMVAAYKPDGTPISLPNYIIMKQNLGTSLLITGVIMLVSALPPILMMDNGIPEGEKRPKMQVAVFVEAFKELGRSFKGAFTVTPVVSVLLIAYATFWWASNHGASSMGINVQRLTGFKSVVQSGPYGYSTTLLTNALLIYNLCVAFPSILFGLAARKTGSKPWLIVAAAAMVLSDIPVFCWREFSEAVGIPEEKWAYFLVYSNTAFSAFGQGPIQSLIRGAILVLTPPSRKGQIMGIFEMFQLLACLLGNLTANLSYGSQEVYEDYLPFAIIPLVLATITLLIVIFTPLGKAEKAKRAELEAYGNMTLDEVEMERRREGKTREGQDDPAEGGVGSPAIGDRDPSGDGSADAEQQRAVSVDSSETTSSSADSA